VSADNSALFAAGAADGGLAGLPGVLSSFPAGGGAVIGGASSLPGIAGVAAELPGASSFPNAAVGSFAAAAGVSDEEEVHKGLLL